MLLEPSLVGPRARPRRRPAERRARLERGPLRCARLTSPGRTRVGCTRLQQTIAITARQSKRWDGERAERPRPRGPAPAGGARDEDQQPEARTVADLGRPRGRGGRGAGASPRAATTAAPTAVTAAIRSRSASRCRSPGSSRSRARRPSRATRSGSRRSTTSGGLLDRDVELDDQGRRQRPEHRGRRLQRADPAGPGRPAAGDVLLAAQPARLGGGGAQPDALHRARRRRPGDLRARLPVRAVLHPAGDGRPPGRPVRRLHPRPARERAAADRGLSGARRPVRAAGDRGDEGEARGGRRRDRLRGDLPGEHVELRQHRQRGQVREPGSGRQRRPVRRRDRLLARR